MAILISNDNSEETTHRNATSTVAQAKLRDNATSTIENDNGDNHGNATSTDENGNGQLTAESHRSAVATFVHSLLDVANREGGIGAQVRVIAREQNDSATTSSEAITKINNRGVLQTIFFGDDYESLGVLRSEIATTTNNISRLNNLLDKTTSDTDKAALLAQIKVLEDSQAKLDTFVKAHGNSFSFFGWFTKMFSK